MAGGTIAVTAKSGFLFWPAPELSGIARRLMSEVLIVKGDGIVNPRCVLILMRAGIACEGPDGRKIFRGCPMQCRRIRGRRMRRECCENI